jgi:2-amino-4-hydroxy-6-hydroxymethyldihydropteridine diphosphokinase
VSLPAWAHVTPERRAHIERVVALLDDWADAMHVPAMERDRWLRAAWLHDALRDAPSPDPTSHGPAAADRAAAAGERDRGVLDAVRYHTVGSADWDDVGRMLYLADFLEPGRDSGSQVSDRQQLAGRVPGERDAVLREVARRRLDWVLRSGWPLPPSTVAFWNQLVGRPDGRKAGRA